LKTGFRRAKVIDIASAIVRVDILGIRWAARGRRVYVYFPTLSPLRPGENHPFSMVPTAMLAWQAYSDQDGPETSDMKKNHTVTVGSEADTESKAYTNSRLTLLVRKSAGMTGFLKAHEGLLTLLEGPYPTNPTKAVLQSDRLPLIGGGIGITGLLPFLWTL
jgi:hypothetical protein